MYLLPTGYISTGDSSSDHVPSASPASSNGVDDDTQKNTSRLAALRRYQSAYAPPEEAFDRLTRLAARLLDTEVAYVNFIGHSKQWTKSSAGSPCPPAVDFDVSFCVHTVQDEGPMVVEDTTEDERFADNPVVTGDMRIAGLSDPVRFYAGMPLQTSDGYRIGTICVMDTEPRALDPQHTQDLADLAALAVDALELRAGYRHHKDLLESITDAFFAVDEEWSFTYVNQQAEAWLRRSRDELMGVSLWEAFPEATDLPFYEQYMQAARTGTPADFEAYVPPLERWFHVQVYPFSGGLSVYFQDVTERKEYEAALEEAEQRAQEAKQNAQEAKQRAESAARLKSSMLANMSHEIRTPLTSIIGFAEVLELECEPPRQQRFASLIRQSSTRLHHTLDSMLQLSKLEADQVALSPAPVNVLDVVQTVQVEQQPRAKQAGVTLQTDVPSSLCTQTDENVLQRVLTNLVSNAVKFTLEGGQVTLRAGTVSATDDQSALANDASSVEGTMPVEDGDPDRIWIAVEDTGIGMSEAFQAKMFKAFEQESTGPTRSHEGSGLGLAIVKQLVDRLGGTLAIDSQKDQGTTVCVTLPSLSDSHQTARKRKAQLCEDARCLRSPMPCPSSSLQRNRPATSRNVWRDTGVVRAFSLPPVMDLK